MKARASLIIFVIVCLATYGVSGQQVLVDGYVYESKDGSPLTEVNITIQDMVTQKTVQLTTDTSGHFSLLLSRDQKFSLEASHPKYETFTQELSTDAMGSHPLSIEINLRPVDVPADPMGPHEETNEDSKRVAEGLTQGSAGHKIRDQKRNRVVDAGDLPLARDPKKKPKKIGFDEAAVYEKSVADAVGLTPRRKLLLPGTKGLPKTFGGFMIELEKVDRPLKSDHGIFSLERPIYGERLPSGQFAYLLGGFDNYNECTRFLREEVIHIYPDAKIIEFKKGTRLKS